MQPNILNQPIQFISSTIFTILGLSIQFDSNSNEYHYYMIVLWLVGFSLGIEKNEILI